ncbi:UNVERIFIED_CONTAM: Retrovirus-related Pol polyprotein from transposon.6 [Sesamum radiatum]|uniref:Retrovirus-related Pol polyprotein from transposon.6 n=1 Tax=Sesamum radiatum TaxID=300843 RepID=A0AAW2S1K8_SESRA
MLDPKDRKKVSFITSEGTFCYVAMSFGLKNTGATYQRLVDKIFRPQIDRNIEVYVDDMLVKSKKVDEHVKDLEETFSVLRKYKLKLNPPNVPSGYKVVASWGSW